MFLTRRKTMALLASAAAVPTLTLAAQPAPEATADSALTAEQARAIGKEIFLWGMHPVAMYHVRFITAQNEQSPRYAGVNRLRMMRKPINASQRTVTTPNATTLYGSSALDLTEEPVVITVPAMEGRYWSIQCYDNYARWWLMIGSQFNALGPVRRLLLGPNWKGSIPAEFVGEEVVKSPSNFAGASLRVALTDDSTEELAAIHAFMDRVTLMPLSQWIANGKKEVRPEDVPVTKGQYPTYPGMAQVSAPGRLRGTDFLRWVSLVLNDPSFTKQDDGYQERLAFERFARVGLKAGQAFEPERYPAAIRAALEAGIEDGVQAVKARIAQGLGTAMGNGWTLSSDLEYQDTDWLLRAVYGSITIAAPVPSRSHTAAFCSRDSQGQTLSGEHRYTLTFDLDNLPPVTEFWEMPLYDSEGYFVENPIQRYSLNSYMLQHNELHTENGKLVIYVQADEPQDPGQKRNWLPAPREGRMQFAARFYGPHGPLIDGSYPMPGFVRV